MSKSEAQKSTGHQFNSVQFTNSYFHEHLQPDYEDFWLLMQNIKTKGRTCQCNDILKGSIAANAFKTWNNYNKITKFLRKYFGHINRTSQKYEKYHHTWYSHFISKSSSLREIKKEVHVILVLVIYLHDTWRNSIGMPRTVVAFAPMAVYKWNNYYQRSL